MPLYATGHNRPGYLPDDDGTSRLITRDWQHARDSLIDDLRDAAEAFTGGSPSATLTVLVARPVVAEVEHLAADLPAIADDSSRLGLILVGPGDYPAGEVAAALRLELLGVLPRDPRGAAWLSGAPVKGWALRRAALVRAAWPLARTLATRLPEAPDQAPARPAQRVPGTAAAPAPADSSPIRSFEASS
jgi:hypothetical protein